MACLDMFNPEHQGLCTPMSPRISFSNDFIELSPPTTREAATLQQPAVASEHFEFSVSKYTMMPADELFFKGTLLPFKKTTLRDELLVDEGDDDDDLSVRPPKVPIKWKEFLGLKKSHIVNKKADKSSEESLRRAEHDKEGEKNSTNACFDQLPVHSISFNSLLFSVHPLYMNIFSYITYRKRQWWYLSRGGL